MRHHRPNMFWTLSLAAILLGATLFYAHAQTVQQRPSHDGRLDKIIEQNNLILKNQESLREEMQKIQRDLLQLRRRSS